MWPPRQDGDSDLVVFEDGGLAVHVGHCQAENSTPRRRLLGAGPNRAILGALPVLFLLASATLAAEVSPDLGPNERCVQP